MPAVARDFYRLQNIQMGPRAHPASYSMGTGVLSCGVKLTTHLHLMRRLRVSGAVVLLPSYVFLVKFPYYLSDSKITKVLLWNLWHVGIFVMLT